MTTTIRGLALLALAASTTALSTGQAFAWGHTGHVGISTLAIQNLPSDLPAFVRGASPAQFIGELGAEADESKTTGVLLNATGTSTSRTVHDAERDNGHFIDLDDNGFALGGSVSISALPATREAFDTAERAAMSPGGQDQYTVGYLPYQMLDGFQQVRKDFGMWRAMQAGLATATTPSDVAYFRYQISVRQQLTLRDIGYWSHFVADGSQPMHVSVHYNGWGNYPNPNGYTTAGIHSPFEGSFVRTFIDFTKLTIRPYMSRNTTTNEQRVPAYLLETLSALVPVYDAELKSGHDGYKTNQPLENAVVTQQLALGAAELRDEIVDAWNQSLNVTVGFPLVRVDDAVAGRVKITPATFGSD
ncbi:MAG: hypothetical protein ACRYF2_03955 [Janthinobacterium lividum]